MDGTTGPQTALDKAQPLYGHARELIESGSPEEAIGPLRQSLQFLNPQEHAGPRAVVLDTLAVALVLIDEIAQAVQARREAAQLLAHEPERDGQAAENAHALGILCAQTGEIEEAQQAFRTAITRYRRVEGGAESALALALYGLGTVQSGQEAEASFLEALELLEPLPGSLLARADVLRALAALSNREGRDRTADTTQRQAIELLQEAGDPLTLAEALVELGIIRIEGEAAEHAVDVLEAALQLTEQGEDEQGEQAQSIQLDALMALTLAHRASGQFAAAQASCLRGIDLSEQQPGTLLQLAGFQRALGELYLDADEPLAAREHLERAWLLLEGYAGVAAEQAATTLHLARVYNELGNPQAAADAYGEAAEHYAQLPGTEQTVAEVSGLRSLALLSAGDGEQAIAVASQAVETLRRIPEASASLPASLQQLGGITLAAEGVPREAEAAYRQALTLHREQFGSGIEQARCLLGIAMARREQGRIEPAAEACTEALDILDAHPEAQDVREELTELRAQLQPR